MAFRRLLMAAVVLGIPALSFAGDPEPLSDLARWTGGTLTRTEFVAASDPDETLFRAGGPDLIKAICKASYRKIYTGIAHEAEYEDDPQFLEEMDQWRTRFLSSLFVQRSRPAMAPTEAEARAFYLAREDELYQSSGAADLEILFVRCSEVDETRCRSRMHGYKDRLDAGEPITTLIQEEQPSSGTANGTFTKVPLDRLAPELAEAVRSTPDGWLTPVIETPRGLFLIRVKALAPATDIPFDQAQRHVRQVMRQEREIAWRESESKRLRSELDLGDSVSQDQIFTAAAIAAHLDIEANFMQAERERHAWALADFAFFRDPKMLPSDDEITRRLAENATERERFEEYDFLLLVVPATADRTATLDRADAVRTALATADEPATAASALLGRDSTLFSLEFAGVTRHELAGVKPSITDDVFGLGSGEWAGPFAFRKGFDVSEELALNGTAGTVPAGIGFVVVTDTRVPTVDEVRQQFYRQARDDLGSVAAFLPIMAQRWRFEIVVETDQ
ncbi:MAG: hypothetical protein DRJ65_18070 [Acidobacteria bacterium]|nr:MAG: hypothetical protein DRJ65_18070 [Acidobacteriota bacterium]